MKNLQPFLPEISDSPQGFRDKLLGLRRAYAANVNDVYRTYGPQAGGKPNPIVDEVLRVGGGAPLAVPPGWKVEMRK